MKKTKTFLIVLCMVAATVGCTKKPDARETVKNAAIKYALEDSKLQPNELKIKSLEKKHDHWLVMVSRVPEVPSGYLFLEVTDDGRVNDYSSRQAEIAVSEMLHDRDR